jgi:cysteinyl-tRNA synthetase
MSLRVYNTLTKQKDLFEPVRPGRVGMYLCGPTVYKPPHIGHMVGPVIFDAIKRYLKYKGYEVTWVVNITDVDDKIIDRANELGIDWKQVAQTATRQYHDCLALLGVDTIDRFPKASEHMPEILSMTQTLIDKGFAYAAEGNVWFDVLKDKDYGKLSNRRIEEQESGTRDLQGSGKRNPADFALWKAAKPGEPAWDSPWGRGRPGWHIECSAMSLKYLGETFDIHGGGMDLMFPHHENELAQSECCTGKPFAKFWLHNGLTRIATKSAGGELKVEKMSKSLGNTLDPVALVEAHGAELLRYLLLSTHYRRPIEFTDDVMVSSRKGLAVFGRLFERVERLAGAGPHADMDEVAPTLLESENGAFVRDVLGYKMKFLESMDDDFNTAGAIAAMHELAGAVNGFIERSEVEKTRVADVVEAVAAGSMTLRKLGNLLGLFLRPGGESPTPAAVGGATANRDAATVSGLMQLLIKLRAEARAAKNFQLADGIRKGLSELNITLEDRPDGTGWRQD